MLRSVFLLFVLAGTAFAQLGRFDGSVLPTGTPNGPANVAVCQLNGSGGPPCSPLVVIYDQSGAPDNNPFPADMNGRYNFYAQPGTYVVQTYGTGYTTTATTVTISVPGSAPGVNPAAVVGPVFNPKNYGAKGDAKSIIDGVTSNGSTTVTSATANFSRADVGKLFWCIKPSTGVASAPLTTIASVQSPTSITLSGPANTNAGSAQNCFWGTQDDTSAILAASTAAANGASTSNANSHQTGPSLVYPGTVYVPDGGYIVSGNIFTYTGSQGFAVSPSFEGESSGKTVFYLAPTYSLATAPLINYTNGGYFKLQDFSVQGGNFIFTGPAASFSGLINIVGANNFTMSSVELDNMGYSTNFSTPLQVSTARGGVFTNLYIQDAPAADGAYGAYFVSDDGILLLNPTVSNHQRNVFINASAPRDALHLGFTIVNPFFDECNVGAGFACTILSNSTASIVGGAIMGGHGAWPMEVQSGSIAYLSDVNVGDFSSTSNNAAIQLDSGGTVYSSMSTIRGNGTGVAIANSGTYFDVGGNLYQNCTNNTCSTATIAQSFSGTQPVAALTHSATNPFIPTDTAQTWMQMTPDQPVRITRIQVTPANGGSVSCTVTPVFQIANGTTTLTQNIANATATDDSGVISTGNTFVAGTAITFAISAAGTCTTPPANMNVNVMWQSVTPSQ